MLYSKNIIRLVAGILDEYSSIPVVVDPVMVTSSGDKLLEEDAVQAYKDYLFPRTSILTPNKKEAECTRGKSWINRWYRHIASGVYACSPFVGT